MRGNAETTHAGPHERRFALYSKPAHAGPSETSASSRPVIPPGAGRIP